MVQKQKLSLTSNCLKGEKGDKGDGLELDYSFSSILKCVDKKAYLERGDTVIINACGTPDNGKIYQSY